MKRFLRLKNSDMTDKENMQWTLTKLHAGLVKELQSDSSELSKFLEHHYFSRSKIPGGGFADFHKGYKGGISARLRLFYLYIVVHRNQNILRSVFRIKKRLPVVFSSRLGWKDERKWDLPFIQKWVKALRFMKEVNPRYWLIELTEERSTLKLDLNDHDWFYLEYQPKHEYETTKKVQLTLKNWAYASKFRMSKEIPEHLVERFYEAHRCSKLKDDETINFIQRKLKKEWDEDFYPNYVEGNRNTENVLLRQRIPSGLATIKRNNACFEPYQHAFQQCRKNWTRFRRNQYKYTGNNGYVLREDDSLYERFGIKNYQDYICKIMNNAWIFFSEDCKPHHFTQEFKRGPWKYGLGGRGNGYHRLGAARIIAHWDDDEKLQNMRDDFPKLECIRPFKSTQHAKDFCTRWEGNFIIPENEVFRADPNNVKEDDEEEEENKTIKPGFYGLEYTSLKEGLDFLNRNKNPERANTLWRKVVKRNHSLQHKYFSKNECDMAASYIMRWLHRPRV